jgi:hypothetical protein
VSTREKRGALRLLVDLPVEIESIGQSQVDLHPALARVYQRVRADDEERGRRLTGAVRDLSTNGAFVECEPLPLLSRVSLRFALDHLAIEAIGWVLWRRSEDCSVPKAARRSAGAPGDDAATVALPRGVGVLFESIPFEARLLVTRHVARSSRPPR